MDWERVRDQVLVPLSRGEPARFSPYRCHTGAYGPPVSLSPAPLVLVEGVYALHPALRDFYRLRIFLEAPWPVRCARLLDRGGPELLARFQGEWVPLEDRYFQACRVRDCCQLVLSGQ